MGRVPPVAARRPGELDGVGAAPEEIVRDPHVARATRGELDRRRPGARPRAGQAAVNDRVAARTAGLELEARGRRGFLERGPLVV